MVNFKKEGNVLVMCLRDLCLYLYCSVFAEVYWWRVRNGTAKFWWYYIVQGCKNESSLWRISQHHVTRWQCCRQQGIASQPTGPGVNIGASIEMSVQWWAEGKGENVRNY